MGASESQENSARWPFGLGTIDEVPGRFPHSKNDVTAESVNAIARRLTATNPARNAMQSYLSKEIVGSNALVEAPPAAIRHFLDEHVAAIEELRTTLAGGPPRWAIEINEQQAARVDLAGQMWLVRVLAADAFDHHSRADDATAWRDAETGWTLAQGLWSQPDLLSRHIALSATRIVNAVAANLAAPAPPWHGQLLAFDADRALAAAMQFNAWRAIAWNRVVPPHAAADEGTQIWRGAAGVIVRGVRAQNASKYAASMRTAAEEIARTHSCGRARSHSRTDAAEGARPRLDLFHIEREAVAKLVALKEQRRRSGEWPESMPTAGNSFCGEDSWRYRREADGSMSLSFVKPIEQDVRRVALLPFSFRYPNSTSIKPRRR